MAWDSRMAELETELRRAKEDAVRLEIALTMCLPAVEFIAEDGPWNTSFAEEMQVALRMAKAALRATPTPVEEH